MKKASYLDQTVYVCYVSEDLKYALVTKNQKEKTGLFKVDTSNLTDIKEKTLKDLLKKKKI